MSLYKWLQHGGGQTPAVQNDSWATVMVDVSPLLPYPLSLRRTPSAACRMGSYASLLGAYPSYWLVAILVNELEVIHINLS